MRILWIVLGSLLLATGTAAAASSDVSVGKDDPASKVAFLRYYPATVVIDAGDTVTWKAGSFTPHTVTSSGSVSFDSSPSFDPASLSAAFGPGGFLMPGTSFNHTFTHPGVYHYFCKIHPGMEGTITVGGPVAGQGPTVNVTAGMGRDDTSIDRFEPENLTVAIGTRVVWTNGHNYEPHTVTNPAGDEAFDSSPQVGPEDASFTGPHGVLWMNGNNTQFSFTFTTAGTYSYVCKLHPAMMGTVVVLAKAAAKSPGPGLPLALGMIGLAGVVIRRRRSA